MRYHPVNPLPQRERYVYHAYGRLGGTTQDCEGFDRTGMNRRVANRGEYDIDGHER